MLARSLVALLVAAAVFVPSAAATPGPAVDLPLVPLQSAQLGGAARSLPLEDDSGVVSNADAASNATGAVTAKQLAKLGRVTGYQLDYGDPFLPTNGVREIETGVERYRSAAAAKRGLAFWRGDEAKRGAILAQLGVGVALKATRAPAVGAARWAFGITITVSNASPIYGADEDVRDGEYVIMVSVGAGSLGAAERLAPNLAKKVDARLRAAVAGKLRGKPAKLPALKAGPPPSGPDPAQAALTTSDFSQAVLSQEKYTANQQALSEYDVLLMPAGSFGDVFQQIIAERTPSEATYFAAVLAGTMRSYAGSGDSVTPVDVSSVGDDAYGALLQLWLSGQTVYEAGVVLADGPLVELVVGASRTPLAAAAVATLAQTAAAKLTAAVGG